MRNDCLLRVLAQNAGIQLSVAVTTGLVERARAIHCTRPTATAALGRTLTAAAMMGDKLKNEEGSVTLQVRGNGPLGAIVCVGDADGYVRGYVQNPGCELPLRADGKLDVGGAVGRGYLMVVKDIGMKEPVTGTVVLESGEIAEDLTRYFVQSEQLPSACALGVLVDTDCSVRCAGGFLAQLMPGVRESEIVRLEKNLAALPPVTQLLDEGNCAEDIARRVLAGFEVEILSQTPIGYRCACSRHKVERALISMGRQEILDMAKQEKNEVTCQFCDKIYEFTTEQLHDLLRAAEK